MNTSIEASAIQEIATLTRDGCPAEQLEPGGIYAFRVGDRIEKVDLTGDSYLTFPKRKRGTCVVRDVPSFLALWGKHSDADSEVYADRDSRTITAVLNADQAHEEGARWRDHRVVLQLRHTDAFTAWSDVSGKAMGQVRFAEFIEDHRPDVRNPSAADLLELAQDFQATSKVTFRSGQVLKSGQRTLNYVEQIDATAGKNGQLAIPDQLDLALAVFDGATEADAVTARLRYRIDGDGKLALILILDQLADVVNAAFEAVVGEVSAAVKAPVLRGMPA